MLYHVLIEDWAAQHFFVEAESEEEAEAKAYDARRAGMPDHEEEGTTTLTVRIEADETLSSRTAPAG